MRYSLQEVADITGAKLYGNGEAVLKHIYFDSRRIFSTQNSAFLALKSRWNDGNLFIKEAIQKGIKIIISTEVPLNDVGINWLQVSDGAKFLQDLAKFHVKQFPDLETLGITGSNGKTIIKEWLYQCIHQDFSTVKSPKSFNSKIGLPLSLLEISANTELGIFEVGISQPGEMQLAEEIFSPKIGVLTNIGQAHLANFSDRAELIQEKIKLFRKSEILIYPYDQDDVRSAIQQEFGDRTLFSFGTNPEATVYVANEWRNSGEDLEIHLPQEIFNLPIQHRDEATVHNVLCLIAILHHLKYSGEEILQKINALKAVEMRLESVQGHHGNLIINDSYNLDSDSFRSALEHLAGLSGKKKALVLTDFPPQKVPAETFYRQIAELTNQINFSNIFLIGKEITEYADFFQAEKIKVFQTVADLQQAPTLKELRNTHILLKGARAFYLESLLTDLQLQQHDTTLEVNLSNLLYNIQQHQALLPPKTKIMAMVKAFSYGLGGYEVAEFLQTHHIDYLGVAFADEGVELRNSGITLPIVVMNPEQNSDAKIIEYNLQPEIYNLRALEKFQEKLLESGGPLPYPIHLKLETGMNRLGFKEKDLPELFAKIDQQLVKVESIFSHLAAADVLEESEFTREQIKKFENLSGQISAFLGYQPLKHILNSAGIQRFPEAAFDMVRIGIGMMGISPDERFAKKLLPVLRYSSVVSQLFEVEPEETVGYSRKHRVTTRQRIATVPVGYADGLPRIAGNGRGFLYFGPQKLPIVGNVCMDMLMLDATDVPIKEGSVVELFYDVPSLHKFADFCNTISYEVISTISRRVKRVYIKN